MPFPNAILPRPGNPIIVIKSPTFGKGMGHSSILKNAFDPNCCGSISAFTTARSHFVSLSINSALLKMNGVPLPKPTNNSAAGCLVLYFFHCVQTCSQVTKILTLPVSISTHVPVLHLSLYAGASSEGNQPIGAQNRTKKFSIMSFIDAVETFNRSLPQSSIPK